MTGFVPCDPSIRGARYVGSELTESFPGAGPSQ